ncbi:sensor domain-containing diguanylate cyclase [Desulfocurvus sp.]|uniref:GGDEF domain-containing protein n=1 Tax=Desulfocurvus sp. TaxID=2871698 RepID=UPI0025BF36A9|nr:sensor domain-containing diguanylate cyclase [Desulfocurvus sp.]MCK9239286.1 sensor domain-containing diguanylate cyclase [Desulfocurvus sp.]
MHDKARILEVLRRNEAIRAKFFEVESEILTILKFEELFARLVCLIRAKFEVPHVWVTLFADGELARLLDGLDIRGAQGCPTVLAERGAVLPLLGGQNAPVLHNHSLERFAPLMPSPAPPGLGSLAVAPLTLDGRLVGTLNQADPSPKRFRPDMDATLLAQLAMRVSLCLSNVTAHEKLARLALCDPLTGLLNRRAMEERLEAEFLRARRYGAVLSVAFIDMDDFKGVNDTLGHDAGDAMLAFFAARLHKMARKIDSCARYAGDEFVVILPSTDAAQARAFMDRVEQFFRYSPVPGIDRLVRFSAGVASSADTGADSPARLLKLADEDLFARKAARPGRPARAAAPGGA